MEPSSHREKKPEIKNNFMITFIVIYISYANLQQDALNILQEVLIVAMR